MCFGLFSVTLQTVPQRVNKPIRQNCSTNKTVWRNSILWTDPERMWREVKMTLHLVTQYPQCSLTETCHYIPTFCSIYDLRLLARYPFFVTRCYFCDPQFKFHWTDYLVMYRHQLFPGLLSALNTKVESTSLNFWDVYPSLTASKSSLDIIYASKHLPLRHPKPVPSEEWSQEVNKACWVLDHNSRLDLRQDLSLSKLLACIPLKVYQHSCQLRDFFFGHWEWEYQNILYDLHRMHLRWEHMWPGLGLGLKLK